MYTGVECRFKEHLMSTVNVTLTVTEGYNKRYLIEGQGQAKVKSQGQMFETLGCLRSLNVSCFQFYIFLCD